MFSGSCRPILALVFLLGTSASAPAQSQPAPFYSLPELATWAEFDWRGISADGKKETGRLRLSCVGRREVAGEPHLWIEVRNELHRGHQVKWHLRKLLVSTKACAKGQSLLKGIAEAFDQRGRQEPVTKLSGDHLQAFLMLGFASPVPELKEVSESEVVAGKLGSFRARHVLAKGTAGGRSLTYHGWLTNRVPFGCARFELRDAKEAIVFSATLARTGTDATSELDETAAK